MRARALLLGGVAVLVSLTAAQGSVECPPSVCREERGGIVGDFITFDHEGVACICPADLQLAAAAVDCKQLRKKVDRLQARYEEQCPEPTPVPTRSPSPTATFAFDCSSATFGSEGPRVRTIKQRLFLPGRTEKLCADLPEPPLPLWPWAKLSSTNHANIGCGDLQVALTSPSGVSYYFGGAQPGGTFRHEAGKWSVLARLNDKDLTPCNPVKPYSLYLSW